MLSSGATEHTGPALASKSPNQQCIVGVERLALPAWTQDLGADLSFLGPELGEHVRLAELAPQARLGPYTRFAMTLVDAWPLAEVDAQSVQRRVQDLAMAHARGSTRVVCLRRHAQKFLHRYALNDAANTQPADDSLLVLLSDAMAYCGIAVAPSFGLFLPGIWSTGTPNKLRQALSLLRHHHLEPNFAHAWLDLGAFPGGMSQALLQEGARRIIAADRNNANAYFASEPRIRYHQGDALDLVLGEPLSGICCDINGDYDRAALACQRALKALLPGSPIIFTIKLRRYEDATKALRHVSRDFATAGARMIAARHLPANKQELCWLGQKL